ncbi:MAG: hypothetical protein IPN72_16940 [Saprospiraceae bacterium]|nr:hypothetical protein [Saprospiraceae bacterium]
MALNKKNENQKKGFLQRQSKVGTARNRSLFEKLKFYDIFHNQKIRGRSLEHSHDLEMLFVTNYLIFNDLELGSSNEKLIYI